MRTNSHSHAGACNDYYDNGNVGDEEGLDEEENKIRE